MARRGENIRKRTETPVILHSFYLETSLSPPNPVAITLAAFFSCALFDEFEQALHESFFFRITKKHRSLPYPLDLWKAPMPFSVLRL